MQLEYPDVSVVLPTYNRCKIIENSVLSILRQSFDNLELIIVNDGSTDNTSLVLRKLNLLDKRVRIVVNNPRIGLPASRNRGVMCAKGRYIFFSEDDLILDEHCISQLVSSIRQLQDDNHLVGAVGPRLITIPRQNVDVSRAVVEIDPFTKDIRTNFAIDVRALVKVDCLHACTLIPREVYLKIGGFEKKLYSGSYAREESDFYFRLIRCGYTLFFDSLAITYHHTGGLGGCILKSKINQEYFNIRNHLMFLIRFFGFSTIVYFPSYIIFYLKQKCKFQ
jgi:glycosyltransferase involved in cell wall biosynthesis